MQAGRYPDDPQLAALDGELSVQDEDFRTWSGHQVRAAGLRSKTLCHPVVGSLTLDSQRLAVDGDPDQFLVDYSAETGSPSHDALRVLAAWAASSAVGTQVPGPLEEGGSPG
jgi:hypothetical protein